MQPCRHLDFEGEYDHCELRDCAPDFPGVKYWERVGSWIDAEGLPRNVQFCKLRGRINGIFQCHNGEMHCYEPEEPR